MHIPVLYNLVKHFVNGAKSQKTLQQVFFIFYNENSANRFQFHFRIIEVNVMFH